MCEVIVFTHSDYNDIWPIVCDSLQQAHIEMNIHFAVNAGAEVASLKPWEVYTYDEAKPYASRLIEVLQKVNSPYVFFFHDIDVIRSFDNQRFLQLLTWMKNEEVDRFYMGVFGSKQFERHIGDMPIGKSGLNICEWFTTPYDVGPSVWKTKTFLELMEQFKDETYRSIEASGIQHVLAKNKIYGFCKGNFEIKFTIGRPFTEWFSFCHMLVRGKWIPPEAFQSHFNFFVEIPQKYGIDIAKRGVTEFFHGMLFGLHIS